MGEPTEMMVGTCKICGKKDVPLERSYFYYPVKCECHSPCHFIVIDHCKDCVPKEPKYTNVNFKTEDLKNPVAIAMHVIEEALSEDQSSESLYET